jgi:hypothetical protein
VCDAPSEARATSGLFILALHRLALHRLTRFGTPNATPSGPASLSPP